MSNKKSIILLLIFLGGFIVCGLTVAFLLDSPSEPIVFENDNSEVSYAVDNYDENADFDPDSNPDPDFDLDSDNGSEDFEGSTNNDSYVGELYFVDMDFEEYKNVFELSFDLADVEKYVRKKYPEEHYQIKDILIDKNETTDNGYNAKVRVDFEGYDTILRQGVSLSYDLDETFNNWDYKGYELIGTEKIYSGTGMFENRIPSTKTGTFVYEAINRKVTDKGQYRKVYVYYIAPGGGFEYLITESCLILFNDRVISSEYINKKTGDTSLHPREPAEYTSIDNGLRKKDDKRLAFTYNENGGMSENKPYFRISDDILTPEEIAYKLFDEGY